MKRLVTGALLAVLLFAVLMFGIGLGAQPVAAAPSLTTFGNVVSQSIVRIQTFIQPVKQTRIVVTDGSTITPVGTYQPISSTAATGTSSIAAGSVAGQLLILHNVGSQTITLTDTGTLHLTGNGSMTADDSTILIWDGSAWNQLAAESAN